VAKSAGLLKAIEKMGTQAALADAIGCRPNAISNWSEIPPGRVEQIEKLTGIPRYVLRPDLYPVERENMDFYEGWAA
jgi:DNA-binding transcriptional regulator YdaS (Cro superfamily)